MNMKKLIYIPVVLILAACNKPQDKAAELADLKKQKAVIDAKIDTLQKQLGKKDSVKYSDVSAVTVTPGGFTNYVDLQGRIDAQDNVTAYPQSNGTITAIYIKTGDHVNKGQTLVQLNTSVLVEQIAQAQAQANLAQTVYQRQKNLWDQKIGTEVQFLQAKSQYEQAQKQVDALKQQADLYRITSPISGTIDQMDLRLGQAVTPGQNGNGIRIVNADNLKVKADVPESYSGSINQGDDVRVIVPDANDSTTLKVTFASKVIDQGSRSFGIEIKLPPNKRFKPNMTTIIRVADYSKKNAIAIPLNAIQRSDTSTFVFINNNGTAKKVSVKVGATYGGKSEIVSGLKGGEELITEGAADLEDGDKVRVLNTK